MQTVDVFLPPEARPNWHGDEAQLSTSPWELLSPSYGSPGHLTASLRHWLRSLQQDTAWGVVGISGKRKRLLDDPGTRLNNVNNHFRRKAADVLGDEHATMLLARLYQETRIKLVDFDVCQNDIPLARLAAANFCAIGANVIYITEAGQAFIESIANNDR